MQRASETRRGRRLILLSIYAILVSAAFYGGWVAQTIFIAKHAASSYNVRRGAFRFTNPLMECETHSGGQPSEIGLMFERELKRFIYERRAQHKASHVSVYYRDLDNGPWIAIEAEERFAPASLLKVPIMMAWLKLAESDSRLLDVVITNDNPLDVAGGQITRPRATIARNGKYTVRELLVYAIAYSDNNATWLLTRKIDQAKLGAVYTDLGINPERYILTGDIATVREYSTFFRILYNATYLSRGMSESALALLTQSDYKDGIVAGVPSEIEVAHKFGESMSDLNSKGGELHDCGIVYHPKRHYLLCIMTKGDDFDELDNMIADVSGFVYQKVTAATLEPQSAAPGP